MSLTSCFKYAIELPVTTLNALLRALIAEGGTAGIPLTYETDGVAVGAYTARVSASLVDSNAAPSSISLLPTDLKAVLHLHMEIDVTVHGVDGLNPIVYEVAFDLPATIVKDSSANPPLLKFDFGSVTVGSLNLTLSGGQLDYTAALFDAPIHTAFAAHPELHSFSQVVAVPLLGNYTVNVLLYDDMAHGLITTELPVATTLRIHFPGNMIIKDGFNVTQENRDFVTTVDVPVMQQPDKLVVQLSKVTTANVSVVFSTPPPLLLAVADPLIIGAMQQKVVGILTTIGDQSQAIPTQVDIKARIGDALVAYASGQSFPIFPLGGGPGDIDLGTTVPTTLGGSALVLQIEPDGTVPCDGATNFTGGAEVAIGMGAAEVQRRMDAVGQSLDGQHVDVDGYDVELKKPAVSLEDPGEHGEAEGHIWVEGTAIAHVGGCVGDVNADYHGPIMLDPVMNADGTIGFKVRAGTFGGDANAKDKKNHFDPQKIADFIKTWNFDLPTIPSHFNGVGTFVLNITKVAISRAGIVLTGTLAVMRLSMMMFHKVFSSSLYWALERAAGT